MKRPWAALGLVLALSAIMPRDAVAQDTKASNRQSLKQNYPNPFNPETHIPFTVGGYPACPDGNKQYRITLQIYDLLGQLVAIPVLQGGAGGVSGGTPLDRVLLPCGEYIAYWDGKVRGNGREAASGIYPYALDQDGVRVVRKAILAK